MAKRKSYDWPAIKREYESGQLSNREISRQHDVPESSLRKRAKDEAWTKRLSSQVKERVKENLLRDDCACATDEEIVAHAAERGAEIIKLHRQDIQELRNAEVELLRELLGEPTKVHVSTYKGVVKQTKLELTVTERMGALRDFSIVRHKRIQLERQAYNLNDDEQPTKSVLNDILDEIDGTSKGLPSDD